MATPDPDGMTSSGDGFACLHVCYVPVWPFVGPCEWVARMSDSHSGGVAMDDGWYRNDGHDAASDTRVGYALVDGP